MDTDIISAQHSNTVVCISLLHKDIVSKVIVPIIQKNMIDNETKIYINSIGRFIIAGPQEDSGLIGRKIIVDTYVAIKGMVEAHSPEKIQPRLTEALPMQQGIHQKISLLRDSHTRKCEIQIGYAIGQSCIYHGRYIRYK